MIFPITHPNLCDSPDSIERNRKLAAVKVDDVSPIRRRWCSKCPSGTVRSDNSSRRLWIIKGKYWQLIHLPLRIQRNRPTLWAEGITDRRRRVWPGIVESVCSRRIPCDLKGQRLANGVISLSCAIADTCFSEHFYDVPIRCARELSVQRSPAGINWN